jgi:hypothetical protein
VNYRSKAFEIKFNQARSRFIRALHNILHQRLGQMGLGGLAGGQALAQVGAQAAQLGYAGDDAGLFGEGWDW